MNWFCEIVSFVEIANQTKATLIAKQAEDGTITLQAGSRTLFIDKDGKLCGAKNEPQLKD